MSQNKQAVYVGKKLNFCLKTGNPLHILGEILVQWKYPALSNDLEERSEHLSRCSSMAKMSPGFRQ